MKRCLFLFLASIIPLASAQEALPDYSNSVIDSNLQEAGDYMMNDLITKLESKQNSYFSQNGTYWQGLETFNIPPFTLGYPDLRRKPIGQILDWVDFGLKMPELSNFSSRVDTYQTKVGHGYVITLTVQNGDGAIFEKSYNVGSEYERTKDWSLVIYPSL